MWCYRMCARIAVVASSNDRCIRQQCAVRVSVWRINRRQESVCTPAMIAWRFRYLRPNMPISRQRYAEIASMGVGAVPSVKVF